MLAIHCFTSNSQTIYIHVALFEFPWYDVRQTLQYEILKV